MVDVTLKYLLKIMPIHERTTLFRLGAGGGDSECPGSWEG